MVPNDEYPMQHMDGGAAAASPQMRIDLSAVSHMEATTPPATSGLISAAAASRPRFSFSSQSAEQRQMVQRAVHAQNATFGVEISTAEPAVVESSMV